VEKVRAIEGNAGSGELLITQADNAIDGSGAKAIVLLPN
jgi:hypothetical protein